MLKSVSFSAEEGEVVAVIGPNGSGKTTLINAIVSTYYESVASYQCVGQLSLCGRTVLPEVHADKWTRSARARHIALLPQNSVLNFPFTVEEVVRLSRIPHATGTTIDRAVVKEALMALDIDHLHQRLYTQLSGGEKQRVQLARVMAQIWRKEDADAGSRLLLLDEPTASLDLGHQQQLMQVIRQFADYGVAVVMVVHDVNLLGYPVDNVLALADGEVVAQGTPQTTITAALMKTLYSADIGVIKHPKSQQPVITYWQ